jgi:hypothetical protein
MEETVSGLWIVGGEGEGEKGRRGEAHETLRMTTEIIKVPMILLLHWVK